MLKKKIWANFQRIIELFTKKFVTKLSEIWVWDPGSEIRELRSGKKPIPEPGSRGQKGTGSTTLTVSMNPSSSSVAHVEVTNMLLLNFIPKDIFFGNV